MAGFRPRGRTDFRAEPDAHVPEVDVVSVGRSKSVPAPQPAADVPDLMIEPPKPAPKDAAAAPAAKPAPALDLDLAAAPAPTSKPSLDPLSRSALDELDDEEAVAGSSLALDLDTTGGAPLPPAVQTSAASPPISGRSLPEASQPPISGRAGAPPARAPLEVDPFDARVLVDYEPPPEAFYMAPIYALNIIRRRAEVVRELALAKEASARAERDATDALCNLGERLRSALEAQGGRGLEDIVRIEQVMRARDAALAADMDAHRARLAEIDAKVAQITIELSQHESAQHAAQADLDAAKEALAREEAKMKRVEIEMRNAQSVRAETPGLELDLANISKSVADLERQRDAHAAELGKHAAIVQQKEQVLAEAKRRTEAAARRAAHLRSERNAEAARFQRNIATRSQGSDQAREQYRSALADLARQQLSAELPAELEPYRRDAIAAAERAHAAAVKVRQYEVGIDGYDKSKVAMGIAMAIAALTILLVLILFPFLYRAIVLG